MIYMHKLGMKNLISLVYIDFEGNIEELGNLLERKLDLGEVWYDNDMDEPYEMFACCETLRFEINIMQTDDYIEKHLYPYHIFLDYVVPGPTNYDYCADISYWLARMITKRSGLKTMIVNEKEEKNRLYFGKGEGEVIQINRKNIPNKNLNEMNVYNIYGMFISKLCGFKSMVYIDSDLEPEELGVLLSKKLLFDISWGEDTQIFVKTGQTQIMGVSIRYGKRENYSGETFKYYFEFYSMMEEEDDLEEIEMHDVSALTAYYVTLLCELESKAYFEESGEMKEIYFFKEALPGKTYQDTKFMIKEMEDPIKA